MAADWLRDRRIVASVLALATIAVALAWSVTSGSSRRAPDVTLPSVVGQQASAAIARLRTSGVHAVEVGQFSSQPAGIVLSQDLSPGSRVAAGTTVTLTVSKGVAHTVMPSVVGVRAAVATARLRGLQLAVLPFTVASDAPRGTVVSTYPPQGAVLGYGDQARLNVSGGLPAGFALRGPAHVPGIVGDGEAAAQAALLARGLTPVVYYVRSARPAGRVVHQTRPAGADARLGAIVGIAVSIGPAGIAATPVPYVVGRAVKAGTALLRSTGFRVRAVTQQPAVRTAPGTVLDELPMGGTKAPAHAVVTLVIAA